MQSDAEKLEGLPVAPFMDREKVHFHLYVNIVKHFITPWRKALSFLNIRKNSAYCLITFSMFYTIN